MKNKEFEKLMMTMTMQMFAEDGGAGDGGDGAGHEDGSGDNGDGNGDGGDGGSQEPKRTYTDADVDRIVAKHKAQWEKDHKKDLDTAREEARKYERMTKEQREAEDRRKAEE